MEIDIIEERLTAAEYVDFLKRTNQGSQYPKERFNDRIEKLVNLVANDNAIPFYEKLGMKKTEEVMEYSHIEWTDFCVE